jgi:NADPH:quinone reductase-like Zn-dependent oxidoreductase
MQGSGPDQCDGPWNLARRSSYTRDMTRLPKTMCGVLLLGHGGFEQLEFREDLPVPVPGPHDVLIRVGAAGINNTDINTRIGWYSKDITAPTTAEAAAAGYAALAREATGWSGVMPQFPRIQGADACGEIVAVGSAVDPARVGDRVLVEPAFRPTDAGDTAGMRYFGSECDGAFAQYASAPAAYAHRIDSTLADTALASFPCAYSAAENMLQRASVTRADTVLVTGASGGVGSAAVQLAHRRGATVIAIAGGAKAERLLSLGAARVLPRGADVVMALGHNAVDVVIDVVGGPGFGALLDVLKVKGRYATAGAIAGPVVSLDLRTLYLKDQTLHGCTELTREVFPNLIGYIERCEIRPVVAATFPLREIIGAQELFLQKSHVGKIVLNVADRPEIEPTSR